MNKNFWFAILFLSLCLVFAFPLFLYARGNVNLPVVPQTIEIYEEKYEKQFSKLQVSFPSEILIKQNTNLGSQDGIKIEAPRFLLNRIQVRKTSQSVIIEPKEDDLPVINLNNQSNRLYIEANFKDLQELEFNGDIKVATKDYQTENLAIKFDSTGSFSAQNLEIKNLNISQSKSGFLNFKGRVDKLTLYSSDNSRSLLRNLQTDYAEITARGSGGIELNVLDKLVVNSIGNSPIRYEGNPELQYKPVSGEKGSLLQF